MNRFLLLIYTLCIGLASLAVAGVCLKLVPEQLWKNAVFFAADRWETLGASALVFLFSLYLLSVSVTPSKKKTEKVPDELTLDGGDNGQVKVSVEAVKRLAERVACAIHGVRETHVKLYSPKSGESTVGLGLELVLLQGVSVPDIGNQAAQAVRRELGDTMNLTDLKVDVSVSDITNAPVDKKRVV